MSSGRAWTPAEDAQLLALRDAGNTYAQIADALDRSPSSVPSRLKTKGLWELRVQRDALAPPPPAVKRGQRRLTKNGGRGEQKSRKCLSCGDTFASAHAGNRICYTCKSKNSSHSPYAL